MVIKPIKTIRLPTGSRLIFKKKTRAYSETKQQKQTFKIKKIEDVNEKTLNIYNDMELKITTNRLENVISKIGEVTEKDSTRLCGMFVKDIIEEYNEENECNILKTLDKKEKKYITLNLMTECRLIIKKYFIK